MSEDIEIKETTAPAQEQAPAQEPSAAPQKGERFKAILSKIKPEEQKPQPEASKPPEVPKTEETAKEPPEPQKEQKQEEPKEPEKDEHKNWAKERIQKLSRERSEAIARADKAEAQLAELQQLKAKAEKDMTPKDYAREAVLEQQVLERQQEMRGRLLNYMNSHENPGQFQANYDYYTPIFTQKDPDTIKLISSYPEAIEMIDSFYQAFTSGAATPDQWIQLPLPDKARRIGILHESLLKAKEQARNPQPAQPAQQPATQPAKLVPDSIKPPVSNSPNTPHDPNSDVNKGATFRKIMGERR